MRWLGALDATLMASTAVAAALLFSSEDAAVFGWGGVFCITPWIGRAALSFAMGRPALPVRFASLGDTTLWRAADVGIMVLWCVLVTLTCVAFILTVAVLASNGPENIGLDLWAVTPFGIVAAAMLRIGVPLILVGVASSKAAMTLSLGR